MGLNIRVSEGQILEGNTSEIRKEIENIRQSSSLIKKYEAGVSLIFLENTPFDMVKKIKQESFHNWFKKLNREIPGLPYFLNTENNSLLFFIMGNVSYYEDEAEVKFDKMESSRFLKEKVAQIRNICLAHNINPQPGINRISKIIAGTSGHHEKQTPEPEKNNMEKTADENKAEKSEKKGASIKNFLDKYNSIAFINSNRIVKLAIVVEEIPKNISFKKNLLVKDPSFPQPFFITEIQTNTGMQEIRSVIIPTLSDIESSISHNNGVYIQVLIKAEDGSYQRLFESDSPFAVETVTSFRLNEKEPEKSENTVKKPAEGIASTPGEEKAEIPVEPVETKREENPYLEISKLRKEREGLLEQVRKLQNLVDVYEEEINKKRSIKGFFGKFFN
jgi:hypothetical protein